MFAELLKYSPLLSALATATIAVAALLITSSRNAWEKRKAQRELFESLNSRFNLMNEALNAVREWSKNGKNLPTELRLSTPDSRVYKWPEIIQDYLNLCSEEYLWRRKGLVDKDVWNSWSEGIKYYLQAEAFDKFFGKEQNYSLSYYGLFEALAKRGLKISTVSEEEFLDFASKLLT